MTRPPQATVPDIDNIRVELQRIWAEIGTSAFYYIAGMQGDCTVIHLKVTFDLMGGKPYRHSLGLGIAFVRDNASGGSDVDDLLELGSEDDEEDSRDRVTLVRHVIDEVPTIPPPSTATPGKERLTYEYFYLKTIPGNSEYRELLVRPVVELPHDPTRLWLLEITMGEFNAKRVIRPSSHPLIPETK